MKCIWQWNWHRRWHAIAKHDVHNRWTHKRGLTNIFLYITNIYVSQVVLLVEFMYLVFTRKPGDSYRNRLRSLLLHLCYLFRALVNSLLCWFLTNTLITAITYGDRYAGNIKSSSVISSEHHKWQGINTERNKKEGNVWSDRMTTNLTSRLTGVIIYWRQVGTQNISTVTKYQVSNERRRKNKTTTKTKQNKHPQKQKK